MPNANIDNNVCIICEEDGTLEFQPLPYLQQQSILSNSVSQNFCMQSYSYVPRKLLVYLHLECPKCLLFHMSIITTF